MHEDVITVTGAGRQSAAEAEEAAEAAKVEIERPARSHLHRSHWRNPEVESGAESREEASGEASGEANGTRTTARAFVGDLAEPANCNLQSPP